MLTCVDRKKKRDTFLVSTFVLQIMCNHWKHIPIYSWSHINIPISLKINHIGPLKLRNQKKSLLRI